MECTTSDEAYEAVQRLLTERHGALPAPSAPRLLASRRRQPVALVRARVLGGIAALASLDWRTAVVALAAAGASSRRAARCQQGAVLGTVIFLAMTGVFVGQGMRVVAHHDTPAWMSGLSTVLLRHGGVSLVLAGWSCVRLCVCGGCDPPKDGEDVCFLGASCWRRSVQCKRRYVLRVLGKAWSITWHGVVHKHSARARGSIVSIVQYAVTLMAYSLKRCFPAHRAHHPECVSPLRTGRVLVPLRGTWSSFDMDAAFCIKKSAGNAKPWSSIPQAAAET